MSKTIEFLTSPDFYANCVFGWANVNLDMKLTGYNSLAVLRENDILKGVVVIGNGLGELFLDIYAPGFQFTRDILNEFFEFCFKQAARLSARIAVDNTKSQKFVEKLGFKKEGVARKGFAGQKDAIIYSLLKEEWANGSFITAKI